MATKQRLFLVAGVAAAGKTTFGEWLASEHGFWHLDVDSDGPGRKKLDEALATGNTAILPAARPVVVDWWIPVNNLHHLPNLKQMGFSLWWFDAPRDQARASFVARNDPNRPPYLFDHYWPETAGHRTVPDPIFIPNIIETLHADGSRMQPEEIARRMGIIV